MEYYHVFNRGVAKGEIFSKESDYMRFLVSLILLNDERVGLMHIWDNFRRHHPGSKLSDCKEINLKNKKRLVNIISFCFLPNHFHFVLGERVENGIEKFMQCLGTSYAKYFNNKNKRVGPLFQGRYKSFRIKSNSQLLYLSAYVNCNSEIHGIQKAEDYRWCSFPEYMNKVSFNLCDKSVIIDQFRDESAYCQFAKENIEGERASREFQKYLYDD